MLTSILHRGSNWPENPQLNVKLKQKAPPTALPSKAGKVTVQGSNANVAHTINEDERREFTNHINLVRICVAFCLSTVA